jgi:hypothetical protein
MTPEMLLTWCLNKVARYYAILALAEGQGSEGPSVTLGIRRHCEGRSCAPLITPVDGEVVLDPLEKFDIVVINSGGRAYFISMLDLAPDYGSMPFYPPQTASVAQPPKLVPGPDGVWFYGGCATFPNLPASLTGSQRRARELNERNYLILLVTDAMIDIQPLRQSGLSEVYRELPPQNRLDRLLGEIASGTRSRVLGPVREWKAVTLAVRVRPPPPGVTATTCPQG